MSAEDYHGIRNALALYAHLIDNREWDRIGEVYAPDGSYGPLGGQPHEGLDNLVEYLQGINQSEVHLSTNHHIELADDGRTGTGRGKWIVVFSDASVCAGNYADTYVKLDAGWRIQSRRSDTRARPTRP